MLPSETNFQLKQCFIWKRITVNNFESNFNSQTLFHPKKIKESVISCEQCCRLKSLQGRWSPLNWEKELLNPLLKIGRKTDERMKGFHPNIWQPAHNLLHISFFGTLRYFGKIWFKGFTNDVEFKLKFNLALLSHSYILTASSVEDSNSLSLQMLKNSVQSLQSSHLISRPHQNPITFPTPLPARVSLIFQKERMSFKCLQ